MVPTEKDDLVEHLKYWAFKFCGRGDKENIASDVMTEAWEEIERLRDDQAELLKALTGLYEACRWEKVAPEIDAAKAAIAKATGGK